MTRRPAISALDDVARFLPGDPDVLVGAALSCPVCLDSEEVAWHGALEGYDPYARCDCPSCHAHWSVYLTPEQALRLGLMHAHA
jgi:hypothetical protein